MKSLSCILIAALACSVKALDSRWDEHWEKFKETFGKHYSEQDEEVRRLIWEGNVAEINQHNIEYDLGKHSFRKGLNEYADLSHDEFVKTLNGFRISKLTTSSSIFFVPSNVDLPDSVDWREQGLVTPIKNQGQCASCWAFSTTGSLEAQHKKKTGNMVPLSEQNLVDCSRPEGNNGCEGGWMTQGFDYIKKNGGIDTEQSYPYTGLDGVCHYNASSSGATITGYVNIPSGDESALQNAVATIGPIAVAIHAKQSSFHLYRGGIYDEPNCSTTELDHAVLAIGYGTENGKSYWLVKNSWGTSWGENGYIKMTRNNNNQCGIATKASYPQV